MKSELHCALPPSIRHPFHFSLCGSCISLSASLFLPPRPPFARSFFLSNLSRARILRQNCGAAVPPFKLSGCGKRESEGRSSAAWFNFPLQWKRRRGGRR